MTPQVLYIVAAVLALVGAVIAGIERSIPFCLLCLAVAFVALGLSGAIK